MENPKNPELTLQALKEVVEELFKNSPVPVKDRRINIYAYGDGALEMLNKQFKEVFKDMTEPQIFSVDDLTNYDHSRVLAEDGISHKVVIMDGSDVIESYPLKVDFSGVAIDPRPLLAEELTMIAKLNPYGVGDETEDTGSTETSSNEQRNEDVSPDSL